MKETYFSVLSKLVTKLETEEKGAARGRAGDDDRGDGRGPAGDAGLTAPRPVPLVTHGAPAYSAGRHDWPARRIARPGWRAARAAPYNAVGDEVLAPPAPAERADRRSGAAGVAALAGARRADRSGPDRSHARRRPAADRGGVRVARPHGSLHGLRPAAAPLPGARGDAPAVRPRRHRRLRAGQARRLHLEPHRRVRLHARGRPRSTPPRCTAGDSPRATASRASRSARAPFAGVCFQDAVLTVEAAAARPQDRRRSATPSPSART